MTFAPEEMWGIDTKIDDGKPGMGSVTSYLSSLGWIPNCATSDIPGSAEYKVTMTSRECVLVIDAGL